MKVVWADDAQRDFHRIALYLLEHSPGQALRIVDRIDHAAQSLSDLSERFRPGIVDGTREHVIHGLPYILTYVVHAESVEILAVFHAAQDKPRGG